MSDTNAAPGDINPSSDRKGKMEDDELLSLIRQYEQASLGSQVAAGATISTTIYPSNQTMTTLELDRYNALNAYFARPLGNEIENRSQIVLPELRDTIEWIMPQLMRMFVGSKTVCRFDAESEQDVEQAELETAVVNAVFMQQNNGVLVLHDFFKDALLLRNGYVEVYTKEEKQVSEEKYSGLTEDEVAEILQEEEQEKVEVLEQREYQETLQIPAPSPVPGQLQTAQVSLFDLKIRRTAQVKKCCVTCLPPEEMRVTPRAREGMEDLVYAAHITNRARSDLITDGFDPDWVNSLAAGRPNWLEIDALARNQVVDQLSIENPSDRAMQEIELRKVILRVDYDGDGVAELRRVLIGGDKIGENEVIEETPFASCAPKRMPHRHTGISLYDEIMDIQVIKTEFLRQGIDSLKIATNQRVAVDWRHCNFDDLLTSRPGGVVRGDGPPNDWIQPIPYPTNVMDQVQPMLDYLDQQRQNRTGIGRGMIGLDADELQDVTKGAMLAQMSAASLKLEMVARLLAEGVKDVFKKIHSELIRHQNKEMELEIAGKWQKVNPSEWRKREKLSVSVGLGSGNNEEKRANAQVLAGAMAQMVQAGMVGPQQIYEGFRYLCDSLGIHNPERYALDPKSPEFAQHLQQMQQMQQAMPPAPPVQAAKIRAQAQMATEKMKDDREKLQLRADLAKDQVQAQREQQATVAQHAHEAVQGHRDREVSMDSNHLQVLLAIIKAAAQIEAVRMKGEQQIENVGAQLAADTVTADREIE